MRLVEGLPEIAPGFDAAVVDQCGVLHDGCLAFPGMRAAPPPSGWGRWPGLATLLIRGGVQSGLSGAGADFVAERFAW